MTKAELRQRMSHAELVEWVARDHLDEFDREMAQREAAMRSRM